MSTQTTRCNSAYVLQIGQADLIAKDLEKKKYELMLLLVI